MSIRDETGDPTLLFNLYYYKYFGKTTCIKCFSLSAWSLAKKMLNPSIYFWTAYCTALIISCYLRALNLINYYFSKLFYLLNSSISFSKWSFALLELRIFYILIFRELFSVVKSVIIKSKRLFYEVKYSIFYL